MILPATRFSGVGRGVAVAAVLLTLAGIAALLLVAFAPPAGTVGGVGGDGDLALYSRIVARLHSGDAYYPAVHDELTASGYGSRSVFNWRTPLYLSVVALFPSVGTAQSALTILAAAAMVLAYPWLRSAAGAAIALTSIVFLVLSLSATAVGGTVLFSEVTVGVLILASASLYGLRRPWPGLVAGGLALFVRELAAPYALVCAVLAWRGRRYRELAAWVAIFVAYAVYFAWHVAMVRAQLGPADRAYPEGWLQFGGLSFVLATASFNGVLSLLPLVATAVVLPIALLGLAAWPAAAAVRVTATVVAYLVLFLFVGKPANLYWGALYGPLVALGLPWAVAGVADLSRRFLR